MSYGGDDRGPLLNQVCWVFNGLAIAIVAFRLVSHLKIAKTGGLDDIFVVIAVLANFARAILISVAISYGYGQHIGTLAPVNILKTLRLSVILQAVGVWTWSLPKLAVVALLQRIFMPPRIVTAVLYCSAVILLIFSLVLTITTFAQCTPLEYNWNREIPGKCWNPSVNLDLGYFAGSYSVVLDVAYATYPILQVSKLQMSLQKKIVVCLSLSLGFVAAITTIYKLTLIEEIVSTKDLTWSTTPLEVWNSIEGNLLVLAASLPLIKPFFRSAGERLSLLSNRWIGLVSGKSTSMLSGSYKKSQPSSKSTPAPYSDSAERSQKPRPRRGEWHELDEEDADTISLVAMGK